MKASAAARLRALVDPAIGALEVLVAQRDAPGVRLSAARDVLDRAGFGAPSKVELEANVTTEPRLRHLAAMPLNRLERLASLERLAIIANVRPDAKGGRLTPAEERERIALRHEAERGVVQ